MPRGRSNKGQGQGRQSGSGRGKSNSGRGNNLSYEDRAKGGEVSANSQQRDEQGQFAGSDKNEE